MHVFVQIAALSISRTLYVDAKQKVVVSNARCAEIDGLDREEIGPGISLAEILQYRRRRGTNFSDVSEDAYLKANVKQAASYANSPMAASSRSHVR
ncbi:PAS-domain containing protein [Bradyrhizobium hereditatis]|uniref:PAS-domain containing protein n=1 Tax=Bradyrhizobium hereditatis TaxID=2821405 RepID=UPI001CE3464B|nr:PAS-domain containing protein [Bradyrhizobium hereditatis]